MFANWFTDNLCFGFVVTLCVLGWCISTICKDVCSVAKKVIEDETVQDVGKGALASWLDNIFK